MKVFIACYDDQHNYVVVAESREAALGLARSQVLGSKDKYWYLEEIPLNQAKAYFVANEGWE